MTMTMEMKNRMIARIQEELADHETYEMMAKDYDNPCKQMLEDMAHEEKQHAHHLYDILKRHNMEVPMDLENKIKSM